MSRPRGVMGARHGRRGAARLRGIRILSAGLLAALLLTGPALSARARGESLQLRGYVQLWSTLYEQVENGVRQSQTGDEAATEASGFSLRRVRLAAGLARDGLRARVSLRLEGSPPALLDAYASVPLLGPRLEVWGGQMKIPSTYEVAVPSDSLDFATRSRFSAGVTDYSLVRSAALSAPRYNGARCYLRDVGLALRGQLPRARYTLMVGNGLGANRFVGGRERKEELYTNPPGAYFFGARLDLLLRPAPADGRAWLGAVRVGGHACTNDHPDVLLDDERIVIDIHRRSWSADLRVTLLGQLELTGLVGEGRIEDDFDHDGRTDYRYEGRELKLVARHPTRPLQLALRYDRYSEESYENGVVDHWDAYTVGITLWPREELRARLDYKHKTVRSDVTPDLDDDVLILALQASL